ncbi:helix-turn-helix domain-containing protein [Leifsonia sp. NPDC080035]|uniref:Helix-turn-helix domain-containing protein n=1 Tax=Leifsonia sp. NPDC080035 TaxID=3143936 RepID=A0AAU7GH83_9MICO
MPATNEGGHWTDAECPVARSVDLLGDRWSLLIVRDAMDGARSFTDFQQRTGIARNILAERLRRLAAHGVIERIDSPHGKRKVYRLTEAGHELFPVILAFRQWGERHTFAPGEAHSTLVDDTGALVPRAIPLGPDGTPLTSRNTRVVHLPRSGGDADA